VAVAIGLVAGGRDVGAVWPSKLTTLAVTVTNAIQREYFTTTLTSGGFAAVAHERFAHPKA
jgi:hypothetical protein